MGVDPEKDLKIITTGGNPERFAALSKGLTHFTIMPEPFVREAEKSGFRDLLDIGSLKIPFWWNAVLTKETIAKPKRPTLLKFPRAMVEAVHSIKTEKESAKGIFSKNLRLTDPEGLERAYRAYTAVFPENLMPTPDGVKTMLDDLAIRDTRAVGATRMPSSTQALFANWKLPVSSSSSIDSRRFDFREPNERPVGARRSSQVFSPTQR